MVLWDSQGKRGVYFFCGDAGSFYFFASLGINAYFKIFSLDWNRFSFWIFLFRLRLSFLIGFNSVSLPTFSRVVIESAR